MSGDCSGAGKLVDVLLLRECLKDGWAVVIKLLYYCQECFMYVRMHLYNVCMYLLILRL